jgi:histidinol dehydrogenase
MKIITGLSQSNLFLETIRNSIDSQTAILSTESNVSLTDSVIKLIKEVNSRGDAAIKEITLDLDNIKLENIEVDSNTISEAFDKTDKNLIDSLMTASKRITDYHSKTLPKTWSDEQEGYGQVINPVDSAGIYIPKNLISTVLMTVIPAKIAGVKNVYVCTPAETSGVPSDEILAACKISKVDKVFTISGAQAIAALAYGTETIPKVDLICGPGGIYTTIAKKLVYGEVGIDGLYGPTETLIIADANANPILCAADLVAQAEHDKLAIPICVTTSMELGKLISQQAITRSKNIDRCQIAYDSITNRGAILVVENIDQAFELANKFAPEHISLMITEPNNHISKIRNAGAIFIGEHSHEVMGDYVAGPSHVMPTSGTAKFNSGLNVNTFLKFSPVVKINKVNSQILSSVAATIAKAEGLNGHAEAAEIRNEIDF